MNLRKMVCHCMVAVGVVAALAVPAAAQSGNIRSIAFYTVKPDRVGDFEAEVKAWVAVKTKGGSANYVSMWASLTGPREYALVVDYNKWAELDAGPEAKMKDQDADLARISERIVDCTESRRRVIEEIDPELSLPDSGKMPAMIRVLTTEVRPEKYDDYLALIKSDVLPGIKKSGQKDFSIAKGRFGESAYTITSVVGFDKWADIDGTIGLEKGIGHEAYLKVLDKVKPLVVSNEVNIYRYQPDLSYQAPPK